MVATDFAPFKKSKYRSSMANRSEILAPFQTITQYPIISASKVYILSGETEEVVS